MCATPTKPLKSGDRVRFAGTGREHVEHLGARAERLDTAGDRPRVTCAARGKRRACPAT